MKKGTKIVGLILAAVLLMSASVFGTLAYLKDATKVVTNTFTVGKVDIELDETNINDTTTTDARTKNGNSYKRVPASTYQKDPVVHVQPQSEASYLFIYVKNEIAAYEETTDTSLPTIDQQIQQRNWTVLDATNFPGVYYQAVPANTNTGVANDYPVFVQFSIAKNADFTNFTSNETVKIMAAAVQQQGLTYTQAWSEVKTYFGL